MCCFYIPERLLKYENAQRQINKWNDEMHFLSISLKIPLRYISRTSPFTVFIRNEKN